MHIAILGPIDTKSLFPAIKKKTLELYLRVMVFLY